MNREKDRRDSAPKEEQELEYRPDINRGTACMLIGIAAASAFNTALYFNWYPLALLFAVIVMIAVVWLVRERRIKDRSDYRKDRKLSKSLDKLEKFGERISTVETNLDLKADKPARSNVRPGSRPSIEFRNMVVEKRGEKHDDGAKDQTAADTAEHFCREAGEGAEPVAFGDL